MICQVSSFSLISMGNRRVSMTRSCYGSRVSPLRSRWSNTSSSKLSGDERGNPWGASTLYQGIKTLGHGFSFDLFFQEKQVYRQDLQRLVSRIREAATGKILIGYVRDRIMPVLSSHTYIHVCTNRKYVYLPP